MITIINYGLGNIQAFVNVYKRLHIPVSVATSEEDILAATRLILPGVGAFDHAMELLNASGMRPSIEKKVLIDKTPVMGICVGMQILANTSDEGILPGLGWIEGRVRHFHSHPDAKNIALPHMGWNDVAPIREKNSPLFIGLEGSRFYFLHSFYFESMHLEDTAAISNYGVDFSCAVQKNNIYGVQFHPEKSHHYGVNLLKNFAELEIHDA
jgi:glutamine amidotransferase